MCWGWRSHAQGVSGRGLRGGAGAGWTAVCAEGDGGGWWRRHRGQDLEGRIQTFEIHLYPYCTPDHFCQHANKGSPPLDVTPCFYWYRRRGLNPHGDCSPTDFKSVASTNSATPASAPDNRFSGPPTLPADGAYDSDERGRVVNVIPWRTESSPGFDRRDRSQRLFFITLCLVQIPTRL